MIILSIIGAVMAYKGLYMTGQYSVVFFVEGMILLNLGLYEYISRNKKGITYR